jgi:hypothetical protein
MDQNTRKCRVLLHLGNSRAFFVDNKKAVAYDFDQCSPDELSTDFLSPSNIWFPNDYHA